MPKAGDDYPKDFRQFDEWFATEEDCERFLRRVRWPEGFVCPRCGVANEPWETGRGLLMCPACGRQASVRAGTIFHRSRYPLKVWFTAMWFVCGQKNGVSALALQGHMGFGSYETAWAWLHKLRRAMVIPGRDLLGGDGTTVEVDQAFLGGRQQVSSGGRYGNKIEIAIAVERAKVGLGRVRLAQIDTANRADELYAFVRDNIAHDSVLVTDGDTIYPGIAKKLQLRHERIVMIKQTSPAHELLPAVHQVASLLKRWMAGVFHYAETPEHVAYYLDEYTFRFNRRRSKHRGLLWYRLVSQACETDPHPLHALRKPRSET